MCHKKKLHHNDVHITPPQYGRDSAGGVARIALWNRALDNKEFAQETGCTLPALGEACKDQVILNVVYDKMKASSIFENSQIGEKHGRGRLNSLGAWRPAKADKEQWLQLDTGEIQNIAGIVTQGRRDAGEWWVARAAHGFALQNAPT